MMKKKYHDLKKITKHVVDQRFTKWRPLWDEVGFTKLKDKEKMEKQLRTLNFLFMWSYKIFISFSVFFNEKEEN